jgi:RND family efflux transporter MFP subunit
MSETMILTTKRRSAWAAALLILLGAGAACSPDAANEADAHAAEEAEEGEASATDARVSLTEAAFGNAQIQVEEVRADAGAATGATLEVPGQVEFDPARVALVSPRTSGRIERLTAVEGDRVAAGQPVAYVLSPAFLTAQNDFIQATRRAETLAGTQDEPGARSLAGAARRRLQLLGAGNGLIARLERGEAPQDLLPVVAPFGGSVTEALALTGAAVEPGSPIFKIADLSAVNVVADVPERALPSLRRGQAAAVRLAAYPELRLQGRVTRIREELDPATRTAKAVIHVPNPQRILRPGMFASVGLEGVSGASAAPATMLTIPSTAVVTDGAERYVFVETGPRTYERREVHVAPAANGRVAVASGVAAGERVVTRGAFTLNSELGKAAFGEDEH